MTLKLSLPELRQRYAAGENISQHLETDFADSITAAQRITISYDLQAGSYIAAIEANSDYYYSYGKSIANEINQLGDFESILEAGVGEAVTMAQVLSYLKRKPKQQFGAELSWSRVKFVIAFLSENGHKSTTLFVGDLFGLPFQDHSIDVVYTAHSLEPNGGREREALTELCRVARKFVVLIEPIFEFATENAQQRMLSSECSSMAIQLAFVNTAKRSN